MATGAADAGGLFVCCGGGHVVGRVDGSDGGRFVHVQGVLGRVVQQRERATGDDSDAEFSTSSLVLSASALAVGEGSSATYTVKLAAAPTDDVTVTVSAAVGSDTDLSFDTDDQTTGNQAMLTFTTTTWDTAQDVTVSAAPDSDTAHGTAVLVHTAASNDSAYSGTTAELDVSERDDDAALAASSVTATGATLTISNRTSAWHYRRSQPTVGACSGPVASGTSSVALSGLTPGTSYTFKAYSNSSCTTANELTSDTTDAEFTTSALAPSHAALSVPEGGWVFYAVRLFAAPTADVVVTVAAEVGGDEDLSFDTDLEAAGRQSRLTFTPRNWSTAQFVRVDAAGDPDSADGAAVLTHTASSADTRFNGLIASLDITESDNDAVLAASSVTETGATLTISNHTGAWHWRRESPTSGSCSAQVAAGTSTATLSSLSAGTAYVFKAYSDASCENQLTRDADDAVFATPGVMLSRSRLIVPEGSTATYTARLTTKPSADVTVNVAAASGGDSDLTFDTDADTTGNQATLTFTATNWSTPQTVTVAAAEETGSPVDKAYGTATLNHTASGYTTATTALAVSEGDNDVCPGTVAVGGANVTSGTIVDDCNTLLALKATLAGTSTALDNWATTLALGSWTGVTADTSGTTALSVRNPPRSSTARCRTPSAASPASPGCCSTATSSPARSQPNSAASPISPGCGSTTTGSPARSPPNSATSPASPVQGCIATSSAARSRPNSAT